MFSHLFLRLRSGVEAICCVASIGWYTFCMYKYMIIAITFLVLGYAGYYFNSSGGGDMVTHAISQTVSSQEGVTLSQLFSGVFICAQKDGCAKPVHIILDDDTTFELFYTEPESDERVPVAQGTWGIGKNNKLILIIDRRFSLASVPGSLYASIDTMKIKEFSKKKPLYDWMVSPVFTRTSAAASSETYNDTKEEAETIADTPTE